MSDPASKDYKATLNLPQTEFPMKGNLAQLEPKMLQRWADEKTYAAMVARNHGKKTFTFHDGPPYANGHMHLGHALNRVLKDMVVKYKNLAGLQCDFVPGWDCHGLPIEREVEKRLRERKIDRKALSRDEFLEHCRAFALEFVDIQKAEFSRLGLFGRFEAPYLTLGFEFEAQEIRELAKVAATGALYRQNKPVYWDLYDQTALAEAEIEYDDHTSPSVYVAFPAAADLGERFRFLSGRQVSFVIWTTTPWTLPANLAICVNPELEYVFYALGERVLVVAKGLLSRVLGEVAPQELKVQQVALAAQSFDAAVLATPQAVLGYAMGAELEHLTYRHVFLDRTAPVILGGHVTLEAGTGLVHTAPGHGMDDYLVGLKYGLEVYSPVKNDGRYDDTVGEALAGKHIFDEGNPFIVALLREKGALLNAVTDTLKHSYPHGWRSRKPVIFRATPQWFISMDKTALRRDALAQIDGAIAWVPSWGRQRIRSMLEGRPDWCISRQRTWGVPIVAAHCNRCQHAVLDAALMNRVADAVAKEGVGVWYRTPVEDFLPQGFVCPSCGARDFRRETDILDVWFDSACSFAAVMEAREGHRTPVDLYLEGSDQHRGWFHSSLLVAVATRATAPYRTCLTHGFVVDGKGEKQSKSKGNVVAPEKEIARVGAEVLRLWVAASDYRDDVKVDAKILDSVAEAYRKIRNTLRYALSNLFDFDPATDAVPLEALLPLDAWVLRRFDALKVRVREAYEAYEFHVVYHSVVDFCATALSAVYFDIQKDALYTLRSDGPKRRSAQTALERIARELLVMLAPMMSFTAEEAFGFLPGTKPPSVFLAPFPGSGMAADAQADARFSALFALRAAILPLIEAVRQDKAREKKIGKSLEAKLWVSATGEALAFLQAQDAQTLAELFIVSEVELSAQAAPSGAALELGAAFPSGTVHVTVDNATGNRCPRCWMYKREVGEAQPLCLRCTDAIAPP